MTACAAPRHDGQDACEGFQWIGQPFSSCDRCGRPYWEHTHEERVRPDAVLGDPDMFELVVITPESAERVRRKWGMRGRQ